MKAVDPEDIEIGRTRFSKILSLEEFKLQNHTWGSGKGGSIRTGEMEGEGVEKEGERQSSLKTLVTFLLK